MLDAWSSSQFSVVPFRICQRLRVLLTSAILPAAAA